ncbi:MAG: ubiquitin carboxyl-terminal hydrolase [Amphiamblys sp. WSBS2006]|nr:MAG: ubiquitin carboxyl-terminal hydrolase [Amphiamblys sp. WSBS2006]
MEKRNRDKQGGFKSSGFEFDSEPEGLFPGRSQDEGREKLPSMMSLVASSESLLEEKAICEGEHVWRMKEWGDKERQLPGTAVRSPAFECVGREMEIVFYPSGTDSPGAYGWTAVSLVCLGDGSGKEFTAEIEIAIRNYKKPERKIRKRTRAVFSEEHRTAHIDTFCRVEEIVGSPSIPSAAESELLEDDSVEFVVRVREVEGLPDSSIAEQSRAGCIGIENMGATCYMNSLFQSLFFLPYFRKAVYNIPTQGESPRKCIPLALKRLFYRLQFGKDTPSIKELLSSFGWSAVDAHTQHDIHEFNINLLDNLERKVKGTDVETFISDLFIGKLKSYIRCTEVEYESSRMEDFYDIQLRVKGMQSVEDSLREYVQAELLCGDNMYEADKHGKQEAQKGVLFQRLPPVLVLHLLRYEYDPFKDRTEKVHDRYEFPRVLYMDDYLSEDTEHDALQKYLLVHVLVHLGHGVEGRHYVVYIRDLATDRWMKFDDDVVTYATESEAVESNYGGAGEPRERSRGKFLRRVSSAYMLVYVRESDIQNVFSPDVGSESIPEEFRAEMEAEVQKENEALLEKEREERTVRVSVYANESLGDNKGLGYLAENAEPVLRRAYENTADVSTLFDDIEEAGQERPESLWNIKTNTTLCLASSQSQQRRSIGSLLREREVSLFASDIKASPGRGDGPFFFWKFFDGETFSSSRFTEETPSEKMGEIIGRVGRSFGIKAEEATVLWMTHSCRIVEANTEDTAMKFHQQNYDTSCILFYVLEKRHRGAFDEILANKKSKRAIRLRKINTEEWRKEDEESEIRLAVSSKTAFADVCREIEAVTGENAERILIFPSKKQRAPSLDPEEAGTVEEMLRKNKSAFRDDLFFYAAVEGGTTGESFFRCLVNFIDFGKKELLERTFVVPKSFSAGSLSRAVGETLVKEALVPEDEGQEFRLYTVYDSRIQDVLKTGKSYVLGDIHGDLFCCPVGCGATGVAVEIFFFHRTMSNKTGTPTVISLLQDEPFAKTKIRVQVHLHLENEEFDKCTIYKAGVFGKDEIPDDCVLYNELVDKPHTAIGIDCPVLEEASEAKEIKMG